MRLKIDDLLKLFKGSMSLSQQQSLPNLIDFKWFDKINSKEQLKNLQVKSNRFIHTGVYFRTIKLNF